LGAGKPKGLYMIAKFVFCHLKIYLYFLFFKKKYYLFYYLLWLFYWNLLTFLLKVMQEIRW